MSFFVRVYIGYKDLLQRAVHSFANLRKSFEVFCSEEGGRVIDIYLSIVEACKLLKKPPWDFSGDTLV